MTAVLDKSFNSVSRFLEEIVHDPAAQASDASSKALKV